MDPLLGGVGEALNAERLAEVVKQYAMVDLFILCVDRDGVAARHQRLAAIEQEFGNPARRFLAESAWEEIETWVLAGISLPDDWHWADVRSEVHVKETYFDPLAQQRGVADGPGRGRKSLGEEASRNIGAIRQKCREDFDRLAERIGLTA